ncbi:Putative phosphatase [[Actinomadura] parvosata subsp. kistnae]|uniref:Phosphatase n=1 Tax=[Actinomadura] parvosata subsp. kistnae TaxID=1909395 RepID=A0A1V0ADJ1_9ACTN|nr:PhoX family phosphatase [Nonomuraea sp. ATCC 55076]AQZ68291.1 phosphatase [Nonomuraea sp. ATCC 55076]SPL93289.1 Putative phosphatase [Actinomadura parvosata subsp. kistnae]
MANPNAGRRLLPLLSTPHKGGRSALTCQFRCGNACAHDVANTTGNAYFGDVVKEALSRRGVLRAGALGAVVVGAGVAGAVPALADEPGVSAAGHGWSGGGSDIRFTAVRPNKDDKLTIPDGYQSSVVVRWGDPVLPDAPAFDFDNQTADAQSKQFGYNCDYVTVFPMGRDRALMWVNHEYTDESLMFRGYTGGAAATEEQIRIGLAAHGGSVVEIERAGRTGEWKLVTKGRRRYNRRITAQTPMRFSGPAAGSDLLKTAADPKGTTPVGMLNNCSGGTTPWGTVLTTEENFNQYFVNADKVPAAQQPYISRYSITTGTPSSSRRFDRVEERFDLAKHPNEVNRFGWIVEIDPFDPDSTPVKRTALGRFAHEAATTTLARDGRLVVYMGDDGRFEYIYKFVSKNRYIPGFDRHNRALLDEGTLYVAKFTGDSPASEIDGSGKLPSDGLFDGSGEWIPLVSGDRSYVDGMSAQEVLVYTRTAADKVGATKMDRPEDIERNPVTGGVYVALTNNSNRTAAQVDEANPRPSNKHGHVLEIVERRNDAGGRTFAWSLPLVCGDPNDASTYFAGFDKTKVSPISCPDNVTFDKDGNLWISTDGNALGMNDGLFVMPVKGRERGYVRQFLTVPVGAETCGPLVSDDQRSVFVAVQHPGETDGASPDAPSSRWPDGEGSQPRPSVAVVWHAQGKKIGA